MMVVLAKSDGKTLYEHIEDCLRVLSELRRALPALPDVAQHQDFWELLFLAVFLHDFGKAHVEFQKLLRGQRNFWNRQRHEIYSSALVEKLPLACEARTLVKRAVLGHHKDFDTLLRGARDKEDLQLEFQTVWKRKQGYSKSFHPEDFVENMRFNLCHECLSHLFQALQTRYAEYFSRRLRSLNTVRFQDLEHPIETARATRKVELRPSEAAYWQNLLLGAATKLCDRYASAGIAKLPVLSPEHFRFLDDLQLKLKREKRDLYSHQKACRNIDRNGILVAPTGSGKTEAALLWLRRQIEVGQGRAFYVLPYTASINAMHRRLAANFEGKESEQANHLVGIQHGKLTQYLSSVFDEVTFTRSENVAKNARIRKAIDTYKKMVFPLKIVTPFQLLKYCYGVKGFDQGFAELAGAKLIFDEIHAYDEITFAQILVSLNHFTQHLDCSALVMTATLPSFMMQEIETALERPELVYAEKNLLERFDRHRVHLVAGGIGDQLATIAHEVSLGKRVMIVCNTVRNAQGVFEEILNRQLVKATEITLVHGRFNYSDRMQKERAALDDRTRVLVGTQAIEVSLDADFDVLFSEPAPLDALLQRFGRVNRKRRQELADVYICTLGGEFDHYIYPSEIVQKTLTQLSKVDVIRETKLQHYLDQVYPDWLPKQRRRFEEIKRGFEASLQALQPYSSHKEQEERFYEKFDGIQLLPATFWSQYKNLVTNLDFFEAEKLLVTVYRGSYFSLREDGRIQHIPIETEDLSGRINKKLVTVVLSRYDSALGLLDEYEALDDIEDRFA